MRNYSPLPLPISGCCVLEMEVMHVSRIKGHICGAQAKLSSRSWERRQIVEPRKSFELCFLYFLLNRIVTTILTLFFTKSFLLFFLVLLWKMFKRKCCHASMLGIKWQIIAGQAELWSKCYFLSSFLIISCSKISYSSNFFP
jgi:hypothetical protein